MCGLPVSYDEGLNTKGCQRCPLQVSVNAVQSDFFLSCTPAVHCTQSSGRYGKWITGWKDKRDTDRQKESKKKKEEITEESGRRERRFYLVVLFCFEPP